MKKPGVIKEILHDQDHEQVDRFIKILAAFTDDITEKDISIKNKPFKKYIVKNKLSEEYKELLQVKNAAGKLLVSLMDCTEEGALNRLSHYLNTPILGIQIFQIERIYSAASEALYHQECNSTGGSLSSLSEVDKFKLRRLKLLFKRYFPHLPNNFSSENNYIYKIGLHILENRGSLGKYPDKSIIQKSLQN